MSRDDGGPERALREALEERNALWAELQRRRSLESDAEHWRERALRVESSPAYRAERVLRAVARLASEPKPLVRALIRRARG